MACPVTDEQLPHDRSADGFFVAAVGGRVAAGEASGAFCGRGDRRARSARDGRRVSGRWVGGAPSQNAVGRAGFRLCDGRILEPEAGAGDVRTRWRSVSSRPTIIPTTIQSRRSGGGFSKRSKRCSFRFCCWRVRWACCKWERSASTARKSTPTPAATARCRMSMLARSRRNCRPKSPICWRKPRRRTRRTFRTACRFPTNWGDARSVCARSLQRARKSRRGPKSAMRANRPSMTPNWRRARPRRRRRARSPAASRPSLRRPGGRPAIRSISPTRTRASCRWRAAASTNATMRKPPSPPAVC